MKIVMQKQSFTVLWVILQYLSELLKLFDHIVQLFILYEHIKNISSVETVRAGFFHYIMCKENYSFLIGQTSQNERGHLSVWWWGETLASTHSSLLHGVSSGGGGRDEPIRAQPSSSKHKQTHDAPLHSSGRLDADLTPPTPQSFKRTCPSM